MHRYIDLARVKKWWHNLSDIRFGAALYYTYIVQCADGTLYTGWTNDIGKRMASHNSGTGARYTRTRLPVALIASWPFETKNEAMSREYAIKRMSRSGKVRLLGETLGCSKH